MTNYKITYNNDTGPDDESFSEWWDVENEDKDILICRCFEKEKAEWILHLIQSYLKPIEQ